MRHLAPVAALLFGLPLPGPFAPAASGQAAPTDEVVLLRLNPEPGSQVRQRMSMQMQMKQEVPGRAEPMNMTMEMGTESTIEALAEEPANGDLLLATTFDRVRMDMEIPMAGKVHYDSGEPGEGPQGPMAAAVAPLKSMVGETIRASMTRQGDVLSFDTGNLADAGGPVEQMKAMIQQQMLPPGPMAVGDSWVQETGAALPGGEPIAFEITWTLASLEPDLAHFDLSGDTDLTIRPEMGGVMQMNLAVSGTSAIDRASGLIHSMHMEQVMVGEMDVQSTKVPLDIKMTMKLETFD